MDIGGQEPQRTSQDLVDLRGLNEAVDETQVLLRYAGQAGIELPAGTIGELVQTKARVEAGRVPPECAVAFYAAYAKLAAKLAPVTIETLRLSNQETRACLKCISRYLI
ncbi:MAG: hypothetical protein M3Y41_10325 [Pseudomonadota bacterium]|nr:hypothetical protein [Pseudomonadota bacterium]